MGTVFRPSLTRPLPTGAVVTERNGVREARWKGAGGKLRSAEVKTTELGERIVQRSGKFVARYRDAHGVVQTISTGCRDEVAARAKLVEWERRAELVKAGVITPAEDAVSNHRRAPVAQHIESYVASLRARGVTEKHCLSVRRRLLALFAQCHFRTLRDVRRELVETWLSHTDNLTRSARTKNTYTIAAKAFLTWAVETERILVNPLMRLGRADEKSDRRRQPRAFTEDEVVRLLDAARRRPLVEARKFKSGVSKGRNAGVDPKDPENPKTVALRPETIAKLEYVGCERELAYKTMILTGLRLGELSAIRVRDVVLEAVHPHIVLAAQFEKNREGSTIPLRADLAADLRDWVALVADAPDRVLFRLTANQVKVFDRDLRFAGIAKRDDRGRVACVHSLRHSFATFMSRAGVTPRTAQAAMRHSTIDLTMSVYTDPRLLDVAGALDVLPDLPLHRGSRPLAIAAASN